MAEEGRAYPSFFTLSRFVHREVIVLLILCGAAIAAFLTTKASADAAHDMRVRDARVWYERGTAHLEAGRADAAVAALGRARALDRSEQDYHLAFSRALLAADQPEAARQALLALRETGPEDPEVNLGLARLEASRANGAEAVRFYQSALYGSWDPDRLPDRARLRVEMIEYLIGQRMHRRAIAQLVLHEADLPAEAGPRLEAANLFLAAGDPARALAQYRRVLALDARHADAHVGAAHAAMAVRDFAAARQYLARAPAGTEGTAAMRTLLDAVLAADPTAARLRDAERGRRLAAGLTHISAAVAACLARSEGDPAAETLARQDAVLWLARERAAAGGFDDPDAFAAGVDLVARAASAIPEHCAPDVRTRAWRLIGGAHEGRLP